MSSTEQLPESEFPGPIVHLDELGDNLGQSGLRVCTIISYGHSNGPLKPSPDTSVDLRNLPNPLRLCEQYRRVYINL